jgi:hypothetical protein
MIGQPTYVLPVPLLVNALHRELGAISEQELTAVKKWSGVIKI